MSGSIGSDTIDVQDGAGGDSANGGLGSDTCTPLEHVVRGKKRGRTRTVPLHAQTHDALRRWYRRPTGQRD